jgi:hypothetical protein
MALADGEEAPMGWMVWMGWAALGAGSGLGLLEKATQYVPHVLG